MGNRFFSISLKFCRLATFGLKASRAKGFLSQPSESAIPACPSRMAEKSPHVGPRNEYNHSAQEWKTNETSSLQHLLTLVLSKN